MLGSTSTFTFRKSNRQVIGCNLPTFTNCQSSTAYFVQANSFFPKNMPAFVGASSRISARYQDPYVIFLPRIPLSLLMKDVLRHLRSSALSYPPPPLWSLPIGLFPLRSCATHPTMLWVLSWDSVRTSSLMLFTMLVRLLYAQVNYTTTEKELQAFLEQIPLLFF
jgi:hypothetical protein